MLESKRLCGARKTKRYCPFFLRFHWVVCPPARCFCAECDYFSAKSPFFFISLQRQGNIKHGYYQVQGWQNALHLPEFAPEPLLKKTSMNWYPLKFMSICGDLHMHHSHEWRNSGARILLKKPALKTKPLHFMVVVVSSNTAASYWPYSSFFR